MKYSIGYRPAETDTPSVPDIADRYDCVEEVYYPWVELPSGRSPLSSARREQLLADLIALRQRGLQLNLLLNASCWGPGAFSRTLAGQLSKSIAYLLDLDVVDGVTVCSPMIARMVKRDFSSIAVRASVNMKLGTIEALEQVADLFDEFTIAPECNRDLRRLAELRDWRRREGKRMQLLANSGCLPYCAVGMFHDNLVAHERPDDRIPSEDRFADHIPGGCWEILADGANRYRLLASTWIRPEDVRHYEPFTSRMKLATRMHTRPGMVVKAYSRERFAGNLLDLFEPSHTSLLAPCVIDNTRFPDDWFARITAARPRQELMDYFRTVLHEVLVDTAATE